MCCFVRCLIDGDGHGQLVDSFEIDGHAHSLLFVFSSLTCFFTVVRKGKEESRGGEFARTNQSFTRLSPLSNRWCPKSIIVQSSSNDDESKQIKEGRWPTLIFFQNDCVDLSR